ncbi:sortase [Candidatus Saccharibacteria bacterium]|nr:sortase [Candidatus Saccharibacteria bacterium]
MDHNNNNKSGQFDASLHLPNDNKKSDDDQANPAADLIRKKIEAAYGHEPNAEDEIEEVEELSPKAQRSKHQEFIYNLTNSERPLHEIQAAWHEYYAGLTDREKHQVWQEFYNIQAQTAHHPAMTHQEPAATITKPALRRPVHRSKAKAVHQPAKTKKQAEPKSVAHQTLHSLLFGLGAGSIVILIFMFTFFNDRIIAPFIQPSRNSVNIPLISDASVSSKPEVIIPKINAEIPVVYDVNTIDDNAIQDGLKRGVVHYADTALPGQNGNVVIVGHSSGNIFNQGNYKFAFSLLRALDNGDTFYLQKDSKRYTYQVYEKKVVKPTDVSVLGPAAKPAAATLITCDPPGLNANRLVIIAQQISPDPAANNINVAQNKLATSTAIIPGNSQSLWSRLTHWFTH